VRGLGPQTVSSDDCLGYEAKSENLTPHKTASAATLQALEADIAEMTSASINLP